MVICMRILITGGCGFVGSNLAINLLNIGHEVTCFDNLTRKGSEILKLRIEKAGAYFVHGDIRNMEDLNKIANCEIMIECSAEPSVLMGVKGNDAWYMVNNNLSGALNCFEWARKNQCGVIFLSTSRVYPYNVIGKALYQEENTRFVYNDSLSGISANGVSVQCPLGGIRSLYGATKLAAEYILIEYSNNYHIPSIINRCGVIAGPWQLGKVDQGVFTFWLANHYFHKELKYIGYEGKGKQVRDLLHIDDLCRLIVTQVESLSNFKANIFNVGGGVYSSLSLLETTKICENLTKVKLNISPVFENRPADLPWYITDNGNTCQVFQWTPKKSGQEILQDIYNWIKQNKDLVSPIFS